MFHRSVLLMLGLWWLWTTAVSVAAQSSPLPLADYWQLIAEVEERVAGLEKQPPERQQTELATIAEQLEAITAVSLPNKQILPIDHSFLIQEMQAIPPDLARIRRLLNAWQGIQDSWPDGQFDEMQIDSLREILAAPEFNYEQQQPSTLEQWWNRLRQQFLEWISRLFPESDSPTGQLLNQGITILGAIALVMVLAYALRGILADFTTQAALVAEEETGERLTADLALQRAQTLSAGGDYRTAVRYLYLSSLLLLEERGLLRYNRYLTNREYLRSVAHKPELAAVLRDVIDVFDRVWYGFESLNETDYNQYAEQVATLKEQR